MKKVSIENLIEIAKTWKCDIEYYVQPSKFLRGYELSAYAKKIRRFTPFIHWNNKKLSSKKQNYK